MCGLLYICKVLPIVFYLIKVHIFYYYMFLLPSVILLIYFTNKFNYIFILLTVRWRCYNFICLIRMLRSWHALRVVKFNFVFDLFLNNFFQLIILKDIYCTLVNIIYIYIYIIYIILATKGLGKQFELLLIQS